MTALTKRGNRANSRIREKYTFALSEGGLILRQASVVYLSDMFWILPKKSTVCQGISGNYDKFFQVIFPYETSIVSY